MRPSDLSRLSAYHQALIQKFARVSERNRKPDAKKKPEALGEEFDSQLELEFAWELERRRLAGVIDDWFYHPMKFRIAKNCTYEPDFMACCGTRFSVYEVKGSWKSKNARDSRTRLQVAAYRYQFFSWKGVTRDKEGKWIFETIHSTDAEVLPMD